MFGKFNGSIRLSSFTVLVTGGAGFIGSALIRHIISDTPHRVINVDKLTYASTLESLSSVSNNARYKFEKVDICDTDALARIFTQNKPDIVMHLAAESHVDRSISAPGDFIQTNIVGTYNLLQQALQYWSTLESSKKDAFRFHHISTDEVFGDLPHPDDYPARSLNLKLNQDIKASKTKLPLFTETTAYAPSSPYSASKASADHLVRAWGRTYGLPVIITNCSNNYGPYHFPEKLIPLVILNALEGKPLPVYGNGKQIRDWLFVEDHARALFLVASCGTISESYNIGGNSEKRNIEVVETICDLLEELAPNKPKGLKNYKDLIAFVSDRPGHDKRYAVDSEKITSELKWKPLETFESGIKKTIEWYINNRYWCKLVRNNGYDKKIEA
tara:strand:+ start:753 stop:1913 length:1161 start_codon:yes stop_codon:yes gene_type:complete